MELLAQRGKCGVMQYVYCHVIFVLSYVMYIQCMMYAHVLLYHPIWCTRIIVYVLCKSARVFIVVRYSMRSGRLEGYRDTFPSRRLEQYSKDLDRREQELEKKKRAGLGKGKGEINFTANFYMTVLYIHVLQFIHVRSCEMYFTYEGQLYFFTKWNAISRQIQIHTLYIHMYCCM